MLKLSLGLPGMQTKILFTYDDYKTLPESGPRYQILDGDLLMTPAPNTVHQMISANLEFLLIQHIRETGNGFILDAPVDVILSDTDVVQPDIIYIRGKNRHRIKKAGIFGPPDLVIEILSLSTEAQDRGIKRKLYARYDVEELWLIDPVEKIVEIYSLQENAEVPMTTVRVNELIQSCVLSGFNVTLSEIFPNQIDRMDLT